MKKSLVLMLAGLTLSSAVLADPSVVTIQFKCPVTTGAGPTVLTNFGSRIAGYGTETIDGSPSFNSPYFYGSIAYNANIPADITTGSYGSSGTSFDPTIAVVTCSYESAGFDPFSVSYQLTNGSGAQVTASYADSIVLNVPVGFKS